MIYGIWCEVWGGVTGSRSSWLKEHGKIKVFTNRAEAELEAMGWTDRNARNPNRKAEFRYTVRQIQ